MNKIKLKPSNFFSFKDGAHLSENDLQELIDDVTQRLLEDKKGSYEFSATGDSIVFGVHCDDEIIIFVSQNYKEACLLRNKQGEWNPIEYEETKKRDLFSEYSRSELIDMLLKSDYNPRKEV